jgi:hypothetical protein
VIPPGAVMPLPRAVPVTLAAAERTDQDQTHFSSNQQCLSSPVARSYYRIVEPLHTFLIKPLLKFSDFLDFIGIYHA